MTAPTTAVESDRLTWHGQDVLLATVPGGGGEGLARTLRRLPRTPWLTVLDAYVQDGAVVAVLPAAGTSLRDAVQAGLPWDLAERLETSLEDTLVLLHDLGLSPSTLRAEALGCTDDGDVLLLPRAGAQTQAHWDAAAALLATLVEGPEPAADAQEHSGTASYPHLAEPHPVEPDLVEPDLVEPDAVEPHQPGLYAAGPDLAEPDHAEPDHAEPDNAEPGYAAPQPAESLPATAQRTETDHAETDQAETDQTETDQAETVAAGPDLTEPDAHVDREPARAAAPARETAPLPGRRRVPAAEARGLARPPLVANARQRSADPQVSDRAAGRRRTAATAVVAVGVAAVVFGAGVIATGDEAPAPLPPSAAAQGTGAAAPAAGGLDGLVRDVSNGSVPVAGDRQPLLDRLRQVQGARGPQRASAAAAAIELARPSTSAAVVPATAQRVRAVLQPVAQPRDLTALVALLEVNPRLHGPLAPQVLGRLRTLRDGLTGERARTEAQDLAAVIAIGKGDGSLTVTFADLAAPVLRPLAQPRDLTALVAALRVQPERFGRGAPDLLTRLTALQGRTDFAARSEAGALLTSITAGVGTGDLTRALEDIAAPVLRPIADPNAP